MLNKRNFIILTVLLALGGGVYLYRESGHEHGKEQPQAADGHAPGDADEHAHEGEAKKDHAEGGEHGHGDKDEHGHGDEHKDDHADKKPAGDEHGDHGGEADAHGEKEGGHGEESSKISENAAKNLNIEILVAGSAMVQESVSVTGRVTLNQNSTAQVKARFPGVIRTVAK